MKVAVHIENRSHEAFVQFEVQLHERGTEPIHVGADDSWQPQPGDSVLLDELMQAIGQEHWAVIIRPNQL